MNLSSDLSEQLMVFKFFCTLADVKLIFANCKSVSVMTGPPYLVLQPKLIWLVVLSSIIGFMTSVRRVSLFFKNFWTIFFRNFVSFWNLNALS